MLQLCQWSALHLHATFLTLTFAALTFEISAEEFGLVPPYPVSSNAFACSSVNAGSLLILFVPVDFLFPL